MSTAEVGSSYTTSLKRSRRLSPNGGESSRIPPLPEVSGDVILEVYTHKSLRRSTGQSNEYRDNERLSLLGSKVLDMVVTHILFLRRPMLNSAEMRSQRHTVVTDAETERWTSVYGMMDKLRCHPDAVPYLRTPEESRSLFNAYAAAVYEESGLETVEDWIRQLLEVKFEISSSLTTRQSPPPPSKKAKSEHVSPPASRPVPGPTLWQPPPHFALRPNPLSPAQPNLPFLPLFNQAATQRRVTVEYPAEFTGPSHAGKWTVKCVVNGILKGVGTGGSKQVAKEESARQAYSAMGWAPRS